MKTKFATTLRATFVFGLMVFGSAQAFAQTGSALALDGVDDYASVPDNPSLDLGAADGEDFTIEAFFYVPDLSGEGSQTLIYKQGAFGLFVNFHTNAPDDVLLRIWTGPTTYIAFGNPVNLSVGWHHIAAVFDNEFTTNSDLLAIYLDGDQLASFTATDFTPGIPSSASALNIGAYLGINPFRGLIDEVRLSDVVRYSGTSYSVPASPLPTDGNTRALWHFNDPSGSTSFTDVSEHGNTLTGFNGAQTRNLVVTPVLKGAVIAWGDNAHSQTNVPTGVSNVVAVAGGLVHSVALKTDGSVVAWGDTCCGQTSVPAGLSNAVAVAAGDYHSLALKADGTVAAWGDNSFGETSVPAGLSNAVAVAAGGKHNLAVTAMRGVVTWGDNSYGQTTIPAGLNNVVAVAAGENHSLALRADGTVAVWGDNSFGQGYVPAGLNNVVAVAAGGYHCLALKADGTVAAWGFNDHGEATVPGGLSNVVAVAGGGFYSLALKADGTVTAWGWNTSRVTTAPASLSGVVAVAGGGYHGLAVVALGPTVLSINRQSPTNQVTTAASVIYRVTFSEHVSNVSVADFLLTDIWGTINGENITSVSASEGTNIDVTVNTGTLSGDLRLDVVVPGVTITDDENTPLHATFRGGQVYTLNRPGVRYVKAGTTAGDDGFSWDTAYDDLGTALAAAISGDDVWVAQGTYRPTTGTNRSNSFILKEGLQVYGGFYGTETLRSQRNPDPASNNTILSGDLTGNDGSGFANNGENSYHVITCSPGITAASVLDGFTISGGNANGASSPNNLGGGIYNGDTSGYGGSPTLSNVRFWGNSARFGGAVYNRGNLSLFNASFPSNSATLDGGAIYNNIASYTISNTWFSANSAGRDGGAIFNSVANGTVSRATFSANSAGQNGGGVYYYGGSSNPSLANVFFLGNSAQIYGGGIYDSSQGFIMANAVFSGNSAQYGGGGVYCSAIPTLLNVTLSGNFAVADGGAIYNLGYPILKNCIVWSNNAPSNPQIGGFYNIDQRSNRNLIQGGHPTGSNTIDSNPTFIRNPNSGDGNWNTLGDNDYGDLRLRLGSPAINFGDNSVNTIPEDLASNPRIVNSIIDLGAYEAGGPPALLNQPLNQTNLYGGTATFIVSASGMSPLAFQWQKNSNNLSAAINSVFAVSNMNRSDEASYRVTVTNIYGSATSSNAFLRVLVPQQISQAVHSPEGTFQLWFADALGGGLATPSNVQIQATTNLLNTDTVWTALTNGTVILDGGRVRFEDPDAINYFQRFYRIIEQ